MAVALLVGEPLATEIDGLRRALGAAERERIPPHLTLVPPINLREDGLVAALDIVRRAAAELTPFELDVGPAITFAPATPTVHLEVGGVGLSALRYLRERLVGEPPLDRPDRRPFVPHVTLAQELLPVERIPAAIETLASWTATMTFDRVHVLRNEGRRWTPFHAEKLSK